LAEAALPVRVAHRETLLTALVDAGEARVTVGVFGTIGGLLYTGALDTHLTVVAIGADLGVAADSVALDRLTVT
jgi:hypothetical protein